MTHLFIELYLDEDVNSLVAILLRNRGYVTTTAREEGQLRRTDREQLAFALEHNKAILPHNRNHYLALASEYFETGHDHYGIIIARRRTPREIVRLLLNILDHTTADEFKNQIRYI